MPGLTRLRIRAGRIRPIYGFANTANDLTASFVGAPGAEELTFSTAGISGAVSYQFRYRVFGAGNWGDWAAVGGPFEGPQNTLHQFQIRGVDGSGNVGPPSNIATATTPYNFPSQINDLVASIVSGGINLAYTASDDATSHQYRYRVQGSGEGGWTAPATHSGNLNLTSSVAYDFQVRGINPSFNGDWSNLAQVTTPAASLSFRDHKTATVSQNVDHHLVNDLALDFVAGNLIVLLCAKEHFGSTGTSAVISQGSHGKPLIRFAQHTIASGEDAAGLIAVMFIANGSEGIINLLSASGAAGTVTNRTVTHAYSFNISGMPVLGGSAVESTTADPTQQTIAAAAGQVPMFCFSFACGQTTRPDQTFDSQTPDRNDIGGGTGTLALTTRVKTKIFQSSPADILTDFADLGAFNGLLSGFIEIR